MLKVGLAASALTLLTTLATAPASLAAPGGARSVPEIVDELQRNGYRVILNKVGSAALEECEVAAVRPGREVTELNSSVDDLNRVVTYKTVYVDAQC